VIAVARQIVKAMHAAILPLANSQLAQFVTTGMKTAVAAANSLQPRLSAALAPASAILKRLAPAPHHPAQPM
jgi:hypothetical protein